MKRKLMLSLSVLMLTSAFSSAIFAEPDTADYKILLNGAELEMSAPAMTENNRTLVPFRTIAEGLGAEIDWDANTKTVTCALNGNTVKLIIGYNIMSGTKGDTVLDVSPQIINNVTYVPLRAISEGLGAAVSWDASTRTVSLTTSNTAYEAEESESDKAGVFDYTVKTHESSINSGSKTIVPLKAEYPAFEGNGRAANAINEYIENDAKSRINSYKTANSKRLYSLYQQSIREGTRSIFEDYYYTVNYEVTYNANDIISLSVTESISSDTKNKTNYYGITLRASTGKTVSAEDISDTAVEAARKGFVDMGYSEITVNKLNLDENSFYIEDDKIIFIANVGSLSNKTEKFAVDLPELTVGEVLPSTTSITTETVTESNQVFSQDNGIVMELKTSYPEFITVDNSLTALNATIANKQQGAMAEFTESEKADALSAYKLFNETKDDEDDRFESWLWTSDYELKYTNDEIASVVTSTYIFKGAGTEATTYDAYVCDLKSGKIISADDLITDVAATDSEARAAFYGLIQKDRLNFYTDVYERFDLTKAKKYISAEGVTYMFDPGELASVSKGVIEVTVPLK